MKKAIVIIIITGAILAGVFFALRKEAKFNLPSYKTAEITRGSVEQTISSTGSLNPVSTIEVGTQVSGTIVKVYVDYNDVVRNNQVIAEIDRQPLLSKLSQIQAAYSRAEAMYEQSKTEFERNKPLHDKGLISDQEFFNTKTGYLAQKATLDGARADVETARTNLTYATIRSPINGTVIKRNVEVGQTVAASLSAPTLFIIAEDLKKMEILADVDESDIGKIQTGQEVSFNVPAYPDQQFKGTVNQIRLQPTMVQNVVTYSVVIKAENPDGTLLPGMTANVEFIAEKADNTLLIPSAALRFKPSDEIIQRTMKDRQQERQRKGDSAGNSGSNLKRGKNDQFNGGSKQENRGMIWILTNTNELRPAFVRIGISNGSVTSITGRELTEGTKVVIGTINKQKDKKQSASRSLFAPPRGVPWDQVVMALTINRM